MSTYTIKNGYHPDKDRYIIEMKGSSIAYFTEDSYRDFAENMLRLIDSTTTTNQKKGGTKK